MRKTAGMFTKYFTMIKITHGQDMGCSGGRETKFPISTSRSCKHDLINKPEQYPVKDHRQVIRYKGRKNRPKPLVLLGRWSPKEAILKVRKSFFGSWV